jgi:hypothetical protein
METILTLRMQSACSLSWFGPSMRLRRGKPSGKTIGAAVPENGAGDHRRVGALYARREENLDREIEDLIKVRQEARKNKNFAEADRIRDLLKEKGIVLEDTPQALNGRGPRR